MKLVYPKLEKAPEKLPLLAKQAYDGRGILASKPTVATKIKIVRAKVMPNTTVDSIGSVAKKRQIINLTGKGSKRPPVESTPQTRPTARLSGFPLAWGKPERLGGCFALPVEPDEPIRPNRGDYIMLRECLL